MLCGKGAFGDAAVHLENKEPAASYGYVGEEVDGGTMGPNVSFRHLFIQDGLKFDKWMNKQSG